MRGEPPPPSLEVLPFEHPRNGKVVSTYLVNYETRSPAGAIHAGSFAVYIFEAAGRWLYMVKEPYVEPSVAAEVAKAVDSLSTWLAPSPVVDLDPVGYMMAELERSGYLEKMSREDAQSAAHYLARDILGYWLLDPLLRDPEIEDVSCEGVGRPVKVWHRRFNSTGWLETNVRFADSRRMDSIVSRLVHRSGRSISTYSPIVDSVLPEGYRLAATWGMEVTSLGSSFTVRKHRAEPFTIVELVRAGTLSAELGAYLWLMLDLKGFVVISGVTASGKTTLLNSLATLLNPSWKIVSIEDTREINLPHSGWKPLHARNVRGEGGIGLFELVKLSLRERPDFVILGEARGEEVQALFQSAAAGSGCVTTFHSPNAESMAARMTQPPLSVAASTLRLVDAAAFMVREQGGSRVVGEVVEPGAVQPLFRRNGGSWEGSAGESGRLQARAEGRGLSGKRLEAELQRRAGFIEEAVGRGAFSYPHLAPLLRRFYASSALTL